MSPPISPSVLPVTVLRLTHSREDARDLADRLLVLRDGRVTETG